MSAECQRCGAKSSLYLCGSHVEELREMLTELPRLMTHLEETALGQTRHGSSGRRGQRRDDGPQGDAPLDAFRNLTRAQAAELERRFLAIGRVNAKASKLLNQVHLTLVRWAQDLCDSRGVVYVAPVVLPPDFHGELPTGAFRSPYTGEADRIALWLSQHVSAIAAAAGAGMCFAEFQRCVTEILKTINPPLPPRFCGPCPSPAKDDDRKRCSTALMAKREAVEVRCPQCKSSHNVEYLLSRLLADVDHWRFTRAEVLLIMTALEEPLPDRTFRHWRATGRIKPRGYRRPDGRLTLTRHSDADEPVYRLADVRRLKGEPDKVMA